MVSCTFFFFQNSVQTEKMCFCVSVWERMCVCVFNHWCSRWLIDAHRSSPVNSHRLVISAIWALGEIKVLGIYWGEKKDNKYSLSVSVPLRAPVCLSGRDTNRPCAAGAAGSCTPWVPLVTSPAGLLLIPLAVELCSLICLHRFSNTGSSLFSF